MHTTDLRGLFTSLSTGLRLGALFGITFTFSTGVFLDESFDVFRFVARGVIDEEYDPLSAASLGILEEVGEVELVLPAPNLRVYVEDEPVLASLRP